MKKLVKSISNFNKPKSTNFYFQKITIKNLKIVFLFKNGLIYAGIFGEEVKNYYIKLYLIHMFVAFINFNGELVESIKNSVNNNSSNTNNSCEQNEVDYSKSEFFQLKIYEIYFIKHITSHFTRIFKYLIRKEEMYLSYIKFKNMYVVDLSNGEIIFDMLQLRGSEKNKKIYKNEKLWSEIMHHSRALMDNYKSDYSNNYDNKDSFYRFVKFECTSTYPRLTFIVKFIPVLKGISIIHMYSQKKLSRTTENNDQHIINKGYKEIDLLYGSEVKNNTNIDFRYSEPKKLQEIEKFFIEFYISIRDTSDIFYNINHEIKYFDYSIIKTINEILINYRQQVTNSNFTSVDMLINRIHAKLYEGYINSKNGADQLGQVTKDENYGEMNRSNEKDTNISAFLLINKDVILKELFKENNDKSYLNSFNIDRKTPGVAGEYSQDNSKLNQSQSMREYEVIGNEKYVKQDDGWMVRTHRDKFFTTGTEDKTNKVYLNNNATLNLSKYNDENDKYNGSNNLL